MTVVAVPPITETNELLQNLRLDSQSSKGGDNQEVIPGCSTSSPDNNGNASVPVSAGELPTNTYEYPTDTVIYYAPTAYSSPQPYMYDYSQGGFDATMAGDWEEYPRYVSMDGVDFHPAGIFSENAPVIFQPTAFGYGPQTTYGSYSPATAVPTIGPDGQLYGPTAFQFPGPFYQPNLLPNAQFLPQASVIIAGDLLPPLEASSLGVDYPGSVIANGSIVALGPRPGYPHAVVAPHTPYVRGVVPLALQSPGGFETFTASSPAWVDLPKSSEGQQRLSNPQAPRPTVSVAGQSPQTLKSVAPLQVRVPSPHLPQVPNAVTSPSLEPGSLSNGYPPLAKVTPASSVAGRGGVINSSPESTASGIGAWIGVDKSKLRESCFEPVRRGNGFLDISHDQNRGPRTSRTVRSVPVLVRQLRGQYGSSGNGSGSGSGDAKSTLPNDNYNRPDFPITYDDAKFFVIKSYSEDNVHKSIKYGIWASTANGNRRLDEAYHEVQARAAAKKGICPLFLFFSVNASGQFCGLAEMTGRVDFFKSVDFWQQDKWNGQFSVKWHIIKDVPNSQFRHIILENNENKPVTNSRDTQEVKFDQGIEMLKLFKSYPLKTSILDDFQFYENRQKAMEDKRLRQSGQEQHQLVTIDSGNIVTNSDSFKHESYEKIATIEDNVNVDAVEVGTAGGSTGLSSNEEVNLEGGLKNGSDVVSVSEEK